MGVITRVVTEEYRFFFFSRAFSTLRKKHITRQIQPTRKSGAPDLRRKANRRVMKTSPTAQVRQMYEETAVSYSRMMDAEINDPIYSDIFGRLRERLGDKDGFLIDTACGSGHMLSMYHERFDHSRQLIGIDLSPRMAAIAAERLGRSARLVVGDMREIPGVDASAAAAVVNFFALHHLDPEGVGEALREWHRVLHAGGELLLATWEGSGVIDYGDEADVVALRYGRDELNLWVQAAGFLVTRCDVNAVEEIAMDAIYLEAVKV